MKNPFIQKIPHNHSYYIILIALILSGIWIWLANTETVENQITQTKTVVETVKEKIVEKLEPDNGQLMRVTGFSSVECHSGWCTDHKGKGRYVNGEPVAAINVSKFGSDWKKVYIPAYDKYYTLARYNDTGDLATATGTDLDIWFGDDQETALTVNTRIMVYLIK